MFLKDSVANDLQQLLGTCHYGDTWWCCNQKVSASLFGSFYAKLIEKSQMTNQPLNVLNGLGIPTYRKLLLLNFPSWSQQVHSLFPQYLRKYYQQPSLRFVVGAPLEGTENRDFLSLIFETSCAWVVKGYNTHSVLGPYCFAVGQPNAPHLLLYSSRFGLELILELW